MLKAFEGYKTYICAVAVGLVSAAHYLGYINDSLYKAILGGLTAGSLAALRAAISNAISSPPTK